MLTRSLIAAEISVTTIFDVRLRTIRSAVPAFVGDLELNGERDGWGPGLLISGGRPGGRSKGSFGWLGMYNTEYWVDPASGLTAGLFCQALPFLEPRVRTLLDRFEEAVYAAHRH